MASSSSSSSSSSSEPPQPLLHKIKHIQFSGRTASIFLQDKNDPCSLLAICNVLSLRNELNLDPNTTEISQENLLSLVTERLIQSNSTPANIAEAVHLLPQLAAGMVVDIKSTRISDFEYFPDRVIFDLLDIPLYHGWIVDPQDEGTANAIGSKSYATLLKEFVPMAAQNFEIYCKAMNFSPEDGVDIVAAPTATLGVPSLSLSKTRSFDQSPHPASDKPKVRRGDREEDAALLMALQKSEAELRTSVGDPFAASIGASPLLVSPDESTPFEKVMPVVSVDKSVKHDTHQSGLSVPDNTASRNEWHDLISFETSPGQTACSSLLETTEVKYNDQPTYVKLEDVPKDLATKRTGNESYLIDGAVKKIPVSNHGSIDETGVSKGGERIVDQVNLVSNADGGVEINKQNVSNVTEVPCIPASNVGSDSSSGRMLGIDESEALASSGEGSEPIYEGEKHILNSGTTVFEGGEPIYEGEAVLAKQADTGMLDGMLMDEITPQQGEVIRKFMENNSGQLTNYGLSCLHDGVEERNLCVLFRNDHLRTMYKFDGELYLLATDQGYLNQHELVWEKLNEVNGDTLFMTGNFKEFKAEIQSKTVDGKLLVPRTGGETYGKSKVGTCKAVPVRIREGTDEVRLIDQVNPWDSDDAHKFYDRVTTLKEKRVDPPDDYMIVFLRDNSKVADGFKVSKMFCPHLEYCYETFCMDLGYVDFVMVPYDRYYEIDEGDLLLMLRVRGQDIEDCDHLMDCFNELKPQIYPDKIAFINDVLVAIHMGWMKYCPDHLPRLPKGFKIVYCTMLPYGNMDFRELPPDMAWPRFAHLLHAVIVFDHPEACTVPMYTDEEVSRQQKRQKLQ